MLPGGSGGRGIRRRIRGGGSNPSSSNRRRCHRGAISGTGGVGVVALGWGTWRLQSHRGKELVHFSEGTGEHLLDVRAIGGAQCAAVFACLHFSLLWLLLLLRLLLLLLLLLWLLLWLLLLLLPLPWLPLLWLLLWQVLRLLLWLLLWLLRVI